MWRDEALLGNVSEIAEARGWPGYAAYGRLRLTGQREAAFRALDTFLDEACAWPFEERRGFCQWLDCQTTPLMYGPLCPEPLYRRLFAPTLLEWAAREPENPEAHLALGSTAVIEGDPLTPEEHLQRALALDPGCDRARAGLVEVALSYAEWAQHHLPDSYIGDPAADLARLDEAQAIVEAGATSAERTRQLAEIADLRAAALDWIGARKAP